MTVLFPWPGRGSTGRPCLRQPFRAASRSPLRAGVCAGVCVWPVLASLLSEKLREKQKAGEAQRGHCAVAVVWESHAPGVLRLCLRDFQNPLSVLLPINNGALPAQSPAEAETMELAEASSEHADILLQCLIDFIFLL